MFSTGPVLARPKSTERGARAAQRGQHVVRRFSVCSGTAELGDPGAGRANLRDYGARAVEHDEGRGRVDVAQLEEQLAQLPDVSAVRVVLDDDGRATEIHVLAGTSKAAKQIVRDIQSVALASFGLELDRRIVSVVQLGENGSTGRMTTGTELRTRVVAVQLEHAGVRASARVTLALGEDEATGFSEGSVSASTRPRMVVSATLDALRQLYPAATSFDVENAFLTHAGGRSLAVVTLVSVIPPAEQLLVGAALVRLADEDALVRATLDASNRRLTFLATHGDH